jgi:hypothetical protein
MKTVTILALAGNHNAKDITILDGVDDQSNFVEYMDEEDYPFVSNLGGAYMEFKVRDGKLYTITEYDIKNDYNLTETELQQLADYTQGQWSDGIGEGFEQFPCAEEDGEEIYLSPWCRGQDVEIIVD